MLRYSSSTDGQIFPCCILIRPKILICNLNLASTNCRLDAEFRLFWISYCVCGSFDLAQSCKQNIVSILCINKSQLSEVVTLICFDDPHFFFFLSSRLVASFQSKPEMLPERRSPLCEHYTEHLFYSKHSAASHRASLNSKALHRLHTCLIHTSIEDSMASG